MSYLRYFCLFAHSVIQHILRCVFRYVCLPFVSCVPYVASLDCLFLIVTLGFSDVYFLQSNDSTTYSYRLVIYICFIGRSRRSSLSFFQQIAAATGGQVYETYKDHIGNVLNEVLEVYIFFRM